uniref:DDE_Tnp_ISL3 domain-containing protein n=1 Tax=Haemonchus contortus TaxID=6289 RepID=A0A7I5ECT0_HAECO
MPYGKMPSRKNACRLEHTGNLDSCVPQIRQRLKEGFRVIVDLVKTLSKEERSVVKAWTPVSAETFTNGRHQEDCGHLLMDAWEALHGSRCPRSIDTVTVLQCIPGIGNRKLFI